MEINNGEYFRILKKMLNLIETALHRGAFIHISTFFPHSPLEVCTNFAYLIVPGSPRLTSNISELIQSPSRNTRLPLDTSTHSRFERKSYFQRNRLMNLAHLQHGIQQDIREQGKCTGRRVYRKKYRVQEEGQRRSQPSISDYSTPAGCANSCTNSIRVWYAAGASCWQTAGQREGTAIRVRAMDRLK